MLWELQQLPIRRHLRKGHLRCDEGIELLRRRNGVRVFHHGAATYLRTVQVLEHGIRQFVYGADSQMQ